MSKVKVAISEALESGEWLTASEITARTKFAGPSIKVTLSRMCSDSLVISKDNPQVIGGLIYKKGIVNSGFGIGNIAQLDKLLREVRP